MTSDEEPRARLAGHIAELDGLRGIAILLVIVHHFWPATGPLTAAKDVVHLGWMGVDLFFVISGFLITGILLDTRGERGYFRNYLARRALRVFPLYYLLVLTAFAVIPLVQPGSFWNSEFVQQSGSPLWYLLYAGNIRESVTGVEPAYILAPLWSLSIEEQFYLTFPFLVAWLGRRTLTRVLVAMVIAAPVFRTVMLFVVPDNERIQYLATLSRMDVLALGALLAVVVRAPAVRLPSRRIVGRVVLALLALDVVVFVLGGFDRHSAFCRTAGYSLVAFTFLAAVTWTIQGRGDASTAWVRVRPLQYLGKICYGVYLLQRPAEVVLLRIFERIGVELSPESATLVLAKVLFTFGIASVSWYVFEKPLLRLKNRFTSSRHPAHAAVPARRAAPRPASDASEAPHARSRRRASTASLRAVGYVTIVSAALLASAMACDHTIVERRDRAAVAPSPSTT